MGAKPSVPSVHESSSAERIAKQATSGICRQNRNRRYRIEVAPTFETCRGQTRPDLDYAADVSRLRFAVIGGGRLGSSLALALSRRGAHLMGYTARTPEGRARAEAWLGGQASRDIRKLVSYLPQLFIIAVPDEALPEVAQELGSAMMRGPRPAEPQTDSASPMNWAPFVLHTSGVTSVTVLSPAEEAGASALTFHPLQTFAEPVEGSKRFAGTAIAVTPSPSGAAFNDTEPTSESLMKTRAALFGFTLAHTLSARPFLLMDDRRRVYHVAATLACNYFVTLERHATRLFIKAGLAEEDALSFFLPLVSTTLDNLRARGPEQALTGPMSRGDVGTVAAHLETLANEAPALVPLYQVLGLATLDLIRAQKRIDPTTIERLAVLLSEASTTTSIKPSQERE